MKNDGNTIKLIFKAGIEVTRMVEWHREIQFERMKSYQVFDVYVFNIKEVRFDKPIYLGFRILKLSKLSTHETYYKIMQSFFDSKLEGNLQLHYMSSDSFV